MEEEIKEGIGKKEGLSFKLVTYENFREMNDAYLVEHNNLQDMINRTTGQMILYL